MTKTITSIHEEIKNIVDQTIDDIKHQKIVSTDQIINTLLDIRLLLFLNEEVKVED